MEFIDEYIRLGHMTENTKLDTKCFQYFLPHHGVIRESSSTTKLRVVFDASAATSSGVSLNDLQMVGPTVQDDLLSILLRFRQHRYVVTSDIEKCYRAIDVVPSQRSLQQIIFRTDPTLPLKTYSLSTVTYGLSSSPYLATKCIVSLAGLANDPVVRTSIKRDFYVDDYLSGCSSEHETVEMCKQVTSILSTAKFYLRKWRSNSIRILAEVTGASGSSNNLFNLSDSFSTASKTLGLYWVCDHDTLSFSINIEPSKRITKR